MKMEFKPDENLTAYELWQVIKLLYGPQTIDSGSIPSNLMLLFIEAETLYKGES